MSEISDFLEEHNPLVIGDERVQYYALVQLATGERWATWACPASAEAVDAKLPVVANHLPTGRHAMRLTAYAANGRELGQIGVTLDGRSPAAKSAGNAQLDAAKASQIVLDSAAQQVHSSNAAREAAERRALEYQEKMAELAGSHFEAVQMMHTFLMNQERDALDAEDRRMRNEQIGMVVQGLLPVVNKLAEAGAEWFMHESERQKHKREAERAQWAKEAAERAKQTNGAQATEGTGGTPEDKPN